MSPQEPVSIPSAAIEEASLALAAVLAGDPPIDDALAVSEALAVLSDVTPPYPPFPSSVPPRPLGDGLVLASAHLAKAIDAATDVEERLRCARALLLPSLTSEGST
jgi:hypothetical protein